MKKIAILGCENSHANAFLDFIKNNEEFKDVEVVGIYSNETAVAQHIGEEFGVPVLDNYTDAVGKVDGLIVTARHGDNHYKYAKPYIESGIPMFIDKPITINEKEAVSFMKELSEKKIKVSGGSSLKQDSFVAQFKENREKEVNGKTIGGLVRAPLSLENAYGGFYFYSQHLVEIVCEIFGRFPLSVTAKKNGKQIHIVFHYEEFDCVGLYCDQNYIYYISRHAERGIDSCELPSSSDWYYREFKEFYEILTGEGKGADYKEFISPVFIMNAIERSLASGKEETISYCEI